MLPYLLTVRIPYQAQIFNRNFTRSSKPKGRINTGIPERLKIVCVPIFDRATGNTLSLAEFLEAAKEKMRSPFPPNSTDAGIKDLARIPTTHLKKSMFPHFQF